MISRQKKKQDHWDLIKDGFLKHIPKEFTVDIKGLDDRTRYYHPIIIINNEINIRAQCDLETDYVYALELYFNCKDLNKHMYSIHIDHDFLSRVLFNWEEFKEPLLNAYKKSKELYKMQEHLKQLQYDIIEFSIEKIIGDKRLEKAYKSFYEVSDYLESNRPINK